MNSGFFPKVVFPNGFKKQTKSGELQTPFFFGGSQVPSGLVLPEVNYNGSKGNGLTKTKKGDMAFASKMSDKTFHKDGSFMTQKQRLPFMK